MQFKLLCPTSSIGAVIGKQGATIKEVRESTNAKIHIDDPVPRCDERVITIAPGAARTQAAPEYAAHDVELALFQVLNHIWDGTEPAEDGQVIARLMVENVGCLIGKGGAVIEQMRADSGARISILSIGKGTRFDKIPLCALPGESVVQVQALKPDVVKALTMVSKRLREETLARPPQPKPFGAYDTDMLRPLAIAPMHLMTVVPPMYALPNGGSVGGAREGAPEVTFRMLVSNNKAGLLIGKGGCVISHLRQTLPGAKMSVLDAVGDCDERIVLVSSLESAHECIAQFAVSRIQQLLYSPDEGGASTRMLLPKAQVGAFLGKGGSYIQDIRLQSNAQVKLHTENLPACAAPDDALLEVSSANFKQAQAALNMATQRLRIAFSQSLQRHGGAGASSGKGAAS